MVTSSEARSYRLLVGLKARALKVAKLDSECCVVVRVFRARKSGDIDNFVKVLLDACNGVLWNDDSQVVEIHAYRFDDKANPRVELDVTPACVAFH